MTISVDNLIYLYGKKQLELDILKEEYKNLQSKLDVLLPKQEEVK